MLNISDRVVINSNKPHLKLYNGQRAVITNILEKSGLTYSIYFEFVSDKGNLSRNISRADDEDLKALPTYEQLEAKIEFLRGELQTIADGLKFLTPEAAANIALSSAFGRI